LGRIDEVDAALETIFENSLAASASMHLGFDHEVFNPKRRRSFARLLGARCRSTLRAWDSKSVEKLLGLIFVNVHRRSCGKSVRL